jgi:GR25 family glycosyltransferase involved in LPS biosynthesis
MEFINKIFFINLEKCIGRREHFIKQCQIHKIPFNKIQKIEAVDGITYTFNKKELEMFKRANYLLNPEPITRRIMGNQLSHYYTLKHIINNKYEYSIICQDDVMFKPGFISYINNIIENFPSNAEIINIGLHKYAEGKDFISWDFNNINDSEMICSKIINPYIGMWKEDMNPCSLCYIVSLQGAKNIIDYFNMYGFRKTTDFNFIDYLVNKKIFYGSTDVLASTNIEFPSEIFR